MRLFFGKKGVETFFEKSKGPVRGRRLFSFNERRRRVVILRQLKNCLDGAFKIYRDISGHTSLTKEASSVNRIKGPMKLVKVPAPRFVSKVSLSLKNILFAPSPFLNLNILPPFFEKVPGNPRYPFLKYFFLRLG